MKAKSFLRQYGRAMKRVNEIERRLADLDEQSASITQAMEADRVQTSPQPDRIGKVVAMKIDLTAELVEAKTEQLDKMNQIYAVINQLEDPDQQRLLRLRYIECLKWEDVASSMHYESRNVFYIHGRALFEVEKIIN